MWCCFTFSKAKLTDILHELNQLHELGDAQRSPYCLVLDQHFISWTRFSRYSPVYFFLLKFCKFQSAEFSKAVTYASFHFFFPVKSCLWENVIRRSSQPPEVFYNKSCSRKFRNFHRKTPVLEFQRDSFKVKKRLQHRCFPVNIAKFLWTFVLKCSCERLLLNIILQLLADGLSAKHKVI